MGDFGIYAICILDNIQQYVIVPYKLISKELYTDILKHLTPIKEQNKKFYESLESADVNIYSEESNISKKSLGKIIMEEF